MKRLAGLSLVTVLALLDHNGASAEPVAIDFNGLSPGDLLTEQYVSLGAMFSLVPSPTEPGSPWPPPAGPTTWSLGPVDQFGVNGNSIIVGPTTSGPFYDVQVDFSQPIDHFSIFALDAETLPLRVIAYRAGVQVSLPVRSNYIGNISALPYVSGPTYLLEVGSTGRAPTFDRVVFGGTEQFDNVSYTMASSADTQLDQLNEIYSGSGPEVRIGRMLAQTFTVGIIGTLAYVDMWLWDSGRPATEDLIVEIRPTRDGLPTSDALAQVVLTPDDVQDANPRLYTRADFTAAGLSVTKGDVLAITLRSEASADPGGYDWFGNGDSSDGVYSRGNGFHSYDGGVTWEQVAEPDWDYMFRTYVQITPTTMLAELRDSVTGVSAGKKLVRTVESAQTYYAVSDIQSTCAVLTDFVGQVTSWSTGKKPKIAADEAGSLIADAQAIMDAIGCN